MHNQIKLHCSASIKSYRKNYTKKQKYSNIYNRVYSEIILSGILKNYF